jgi:recombination protein RecA
VSYGFVQKSGSWYSYNDERIGQGKENVRTFLKENPDAARELETKIRQKVFGLPVAVSDQPAQQALKEAGR